MPADLSPVRPGNAERLSRMVQLATTADDGDEPFAAFEALLAAEYPRAHARLALEKVTDRGLLYLWKGASSDRPVVLMAHYDVVPADESWNPFDGTIRDGMLWGRGTLDDKGPLLVIMEAVENLVTDNMTPAQDVYLSFGGNEETYGTAAKTIAALFKERGITPWLVLDEGGAGCAQPVGGTAARGSWPDLHRWPVGPRHRPVRRVGRASRSVTRRQNGRSRPSEAA